MFSKKQQPSLLEGYLTSRVLLVQCLKLIQINRRNEVLVKICHEKEILQPHCLKVLRINLIFYTLESKILRFFFRPDFFSPNCNGALHRFFFREKKTGQYCTRNHYVAQSPLKNYWKTTLRTPCIPGPPPLLPLTTQTTTV